MHNKKNKGKNMSDNMIENAVSKSGQNYIT